MTLAAGYLLNTVTAAVPGSAVQVYRAGTLVTDAATLAALATAGAQTALATDPTIAAAAKIAANLRAKGADELTIQGVMMAALSGGSDTTKAYVDAQDAATLVAAEAASDPLGAAAAAQTTAEGFATAADVVNLATAATAATAGDATNLAAAKAYADGVTTATSVLAALNAAAAPVNINGQKIANSAAPTAAGDLATKAYVDGLATGLAVKAAVNYATTGALPANTYANGALGVGATITITALGVFPTTDGQVPQVNDRLLVKDETAGNAPNNGVYLLTTLGDAGTQAVLTRATDVDTAAELAGASVFVDAGTANDNRTYVLPQTGITVGTTALTWTLFSNPGALVPGTGLTQVGNTLNSTGAFGALNLATTGDVAAPHVVGSGAAPSVTAGTGAGAAAVVTVTGNDKSGVVQVVTSALDTPPASSDICTVTFNRAYASAPRVTFMPSNDAAWALAFAVVRMRDTDTTTAAFKLRSGTVPLPALTGATYRFTYQVG